MNAFRRTHKQNLTINQTPNDSQNNSSNPRNFIFITSHTIRAFVCVRSRLFLLRLIRMCGRTHSWAHSHVHMHARILRELAFETRGKNTGRWAVTRGVRAAHVLISFCSSFCIHKSSQCRVLTRIHSQSAQQDSVGESWRRTSFPIDIIYSLFCLRFYGAHADLDCSLALYIWMCLTRYKSAGKCQLLKSTCNRLVWWSRHLVWAKLN